MTQIHASTTPAAPGRVSNRASRPTAAIRTISYVARLFPKGDDAILKKIGEEATETVMAAKDARPAARRRRSSARSPTCGFTAS